MSNSVLPFDYFSEVEKGEFTNATVKQLRQLLNMLPRMNGEALDIMLEWVSGEGHMAYWYKQQYQSGVDWLINDFKQWGMSE